MIHDLDPDAHLARAVEDNAPEMDRDEDEHDDEWYRQQAEEDRAERGLERLGYL